MRRLTALLLIFVLLFSSFAFAGFEDEKEASDDDMDTGATYNQEEGNADIVTDTSDGKLVAATTEQWAIVKIQGSYTLTKYSMIINDDKIHVGTFQDVEWIKGIESGTYKNSKEDIDNFITVASNNSDYTEEEIRNTGFKIRAQVLIHARPPGGTFAPRVIEDNYKWLTSKNGDGTGGKTWIANKVMDAANNLGGSNTEGWAEYTVPPQNKTNVIASYIKLAGYEDGKVIYETFKESELIDTEYNELTGEVIPEMTLDLEGSTALLNDVLVSPKEISNSPNDVIWDETLPRSDTYQIEPKAEDVAFYNFGRVTSDRRIIEEFEENISKEIAMIEQNLTRAEIRYNEIYGDDGKPKNNVASWIQKAELENTMVFRTNMTANQMLGIEEYTPTEQLGEEDIKDIGKTALNVAGKVISVVSLGSIKKIDSEKENEEEIKKDLPEMPNDRLIDKLYAEYNGEITKEEIDDVLDSNLTKIDEFGNREEVSVRELEKMISNKINNSDNTNNNVNDTEISNSTVVDISNNMDNATLEQLKNGTLTIGELYEAIKQTIYYTAKLKSFEKVPTLESSRPKDELINYDNAEENVRNYIEIKEKNSNKKMPEEIADLFIAIINDMRMGNITKGAAEKIILKKKSIPELRMQVEGFEKEYEVLEQEFEKGYMTESELETKKEILKNLISRLKQTIKKAINSSNMISDEVSFKLNSEIVDLENDISKVVKAPNLLAPSGAKRLATVHLRYLVIPQSYQVNIIEWIDENGNVVNTTTFGSKSNLVPLSNGNDGLLIDDIRHSRPTEYGDVDLVDWYTGDTTNDGSIAVPNGVNSGTTIMDPVETFNLGDTIYVTWELKLPPAGLSSGDVPEWRLSKYEDSTNFIKNENLIMSLSDMHWGCHGNDLGNEGDYEGDYDIILPNKKKSISSNSPSNSSMKNVNESWFHSEVVGSNSSSRIYKSSSSGNGNATVTFDADLTLVKSDDFMQLKVADWVETESKKNELMQYTLYSDTKGGNYLGSNAENKKSDLEYVLKNKVTYTDRWRRNTTPSPTFFNPSPSHTHSKESNVLNPRYTVFSQPIEYSFERYIPQVNDTQVFNFSGISNETSGKTEISLQENAELTVYPEVPMLFEDVSGAESIVFVAGDLGRKIKPVTYHTMEYKLFADAETVGTSIATDFKAKNKASTLIGNKPVLHKGSGANTSFDIKRSSSNNDRGYLEVKTFALDISDNTVKNDWGNGSYDTSNINQDFLDKWTFTGEAKSSLEIERPNGAGGVAYTGPNKVQNVTLTRDYTNTVTHNLIVRGGELTHVNGTPINTIRTSDSELYEALEGMKLVGANKDQTVLKTFVHKAGKLLSENDFKNLAANARNGIDNLNMNEGWYSEDSTVLEVNEHITRYNVPKIMFADKIPMSVNGLETPINKNMFYSDMSRGYATLNLEIESADLGQGVGRVSSYFDITTRQNSGFNDVEALYGVPNVSVTDTMGGW